MNRDVKSQTLEELQREMQEWDQPAYRAGQLVEWLYQHRVTTWEAMSNLPRALRAKMVPDQINERPRL